MNADPENDAETEIIIGGNKVSSASARSVFGNIQDHNTFENPENVVIKDIDAEVVNGGTAIKVKLPKASVTAITAVEA